MRLYHSLCSRKTNKDHRQWKTTNICNYRTRIRPVVLKPHDRAARSLAPNFSSPEYCLEFPATIFFGGDRVLAWVGCGLIRTKKIMQLFSSRVQGQRPSQCLRQLAFVYCLNALSTASCSRSQHVVSSFPSLSTSFNSTPRNLSKAGL